MNLERIADAGGAVAEGSLEEGLQRVWSVEVDALIAAARKPEAGQRPGRPNT